jgi:hypothetical protein
VALDSTVLRARGGVWHKKDKEAGKVPHSSIDTEAGWTKSGWHGWVYGWKLHLATTVASSVWIPLAAQLTPANVADNRIAPLLIEGLLEEAPRFVLGDTHYNAPEVRARAASRVRGSWWRAGGDPTRIPTPGGGGQAHLPQVAPRGDRELQRALQVCLRRPRGAVPTKGEADTARFALGAIFVYQLALLHRHEQDLDTNRGLKAFLRAA